MIRNNHRSLSVLLLAATGFASCAPTQGKTDDAKAAETPSVEVVALQKGRLSSTLQLPGELQAWQQVDLYAKESGFIKKLYADVGAEVKQGQLLATLEAPELNSRLAGAESRLQSLEAIYTGSKATYDRLYETSKTPGTVSQNDLDQAAARKNSDYAQLQAARAAYREVGATRDYLEIRAPFSGVISARNVHTGAYVGPSGKGAELPLFTLQEQKKLRLVFSVPEAYTAYLDDSSEIRFTVKSRPEESFSARVNRQAGALDSRLRSERIEMDVLNEDKKLLPGMVAEVTLQMAPSDSTFIVPKTAVVNGTERIFVVRVNNGKAEWVDVRKGREADGKTEIFGALRTGDQVLKTATDEVREGSGVGKVKQAN